jgi:membrane peptidoglycan carboxypeptidase
MRMRDNSLLSNAVSLLVCGLLAGLVVAAAAFPAVAMAGLAAKAGSDAFDNLPSELDVIPAPQISYVYASDGKTLLALLYDENRRDVASSEMSPMLQQAIVAAEDSRFYDHHGVDIKGVARAFVANQQSSGVSQGASTLTQQLVRQELSYSARTPQQVVDATEQTPKRKLAEMRYALALEKKLNKQQILERYLNIASFGHGAYGCFAAAQVYFGKSCKDLTLPEAALLAGLPKAPSTYDPADPKKRELALDRREYVLKQMVDLKYITEQQANDAKKAELKIIGQKSPEGCASVQRPELGPGFYCDYLYRWWLSQDAFGSDAYERENRLKSGGYTIISALDIGVQGAAKKNVEEALATGSPYALMLNAIQPGTGRILAMATNRNFSNDNSGNGPNTNPAKSGQKGNYPNTTAPFISGGGDIDGYQAGSTFKMFTMVAALEKGLPLDYPINAVSPYKSKYVVDSAGTAACKGTSNYCVVNANPSWMNGLRNMWSGFGRSVNTYFVPLQERVGSDAASAVAKKLGIQFRSHGTPEAPSDYEFANDPNLAASWGPFTLGVSATTPLDLSNAYATLAADGNYCEPLPVVEIRDLTGAKLDAANPRCKSVVTPDVARAAVDAARCPLGDESQVSRCNSDGGTAPEVHGLVGRPVFGKTGTTDSNATATLVASTRQVAIAGMLADPDTPRSTRLAGAFGNNPHAPVNRAAERTLRDAMANLPAMNFTPPSSGIAFGQRANIPSVKCQSVAAATAALQKAGFTVNQNPDPVTSDCPAGTVAGTEPNGQTVKNGIVTINISKGGGGGSPPGNGGGGGGGPVDPRCKINPRFCPPPPN